MATADLLRNFGRDIAVVATATGPDLDLGRTSTGTQTLANSLYCRLTTPFGSVIGAPNECLDVRQLLGLGATSAGLQNIQDSIKAQCERDQRVLAAQVICLYNLGSNTMTATINISTAQGPFSLTLSVSDLTVEIITASVLA